MTAVKDLLPPLLDYWVARAQGWSPDKFAPGPHAFLEEVAGSLACIVEPLPDGQVLDYITCAETQGWRYSPSTEWAQGGPIIERERIAAFPSQTKDGGVMWTASVEGPGTIETFGFYFERPTDACLDGMAFGPTPLIAAMRAKVASKFGEEVPDTP